MCYFVKKQKKNRHASIFAPEPLSFYLPSWTARNTISINSKTSLPTPHLFLHSLSLSVKYNEYSIHCVLLSVFFSSFAPGLCGLTLFFRFRDSLTETEYLQQLCQGTQHKKNKRVIVHEQKALFRLNVPSDITHHIQYLKTLE